MELRGQILQRPVPSNVSAGDESATTDTAPAPHKRPTVSGAPSILVVDDDECMRELVYLHLSNAGYKVTTAEDAVVALKLLLHRRPHLMVVDVDMPYMNGLEFVGAVKGDPLYRGIPVLFLTARHDVDEEAQKLGVLACLKKPLLASLLLSSVAAALPGHRLAR